MSNSSGGHFGGNLSEDIRKTLEVLDSVDVVGRQAADAESPEEHLERLIKAYPELAVRIVNGIGLK